MIVARRVAATLRELGITRVYGLPGEDHMTLLDALTREGLTYHTAVNESSAVIMAATEAQLSGVPGVVVLSLAPGVSNGLNGLAHAALESSPVVAISGNFAAHREPFVVRQWFDLRRLVEPYVKWSGRISATTNAVLAVCKAVDIASAQRPGPVFLEIPDEVATKEESGTAGSASAVKVLTDQWADRGPTRLAGSPPTNRSAESFGGALAAARRPVLVLGGRRSDVSRETVAAFASRFRVPVFTSSGQKGVLGRDTSDFYAGTWLNGSLESSVVERSDLLILVNPEAFDYYNKPWPYSMRTVAISPAAFEEWLYSFDERIVADPDAMLRAAVDSGPASASEWTADEVSDYRSSLRNALLPSDHQELTVPLAVDAALRSAPSGTRLTADAGFSKPIVAMLSEPEQRGDYFASNGLSTMGYSIPAAIAVARHGRPVLAFLGDGSLLMRATELVYARGLDTPLVIVAIMDKSLSQIEIKQERLGLGTVGVTVPEVSCTSLAESVGATGVDVRDAEHLGTELEAAWERGGTTLVGVHVSPESSRQFFEVVRG